MRCSIIKDRGVLHRPSLHSTGDEMSSFNRSGIVIPLFLVVLLAGCASIDHKVLVAAVPSGGAPRDIAIFFDGTANDERSDTNIAKLHSLVTLQKRDNIAAIYIEGVGADADISGMAFGVGSKARVQLAYEFLLNTYKPSDRIFIFGFSRGAYSARVLNSLLYHAGIVKNETESAGGEIHALSNKELAELVFDTVKTEFFEPNGEKGRRKRVQDTFALPMSYMGYSVRVKAGSRPVHVEFLGLWDTVGALGGGLGDAASKLAHKFGVRQHMVSVDAENNAYGDKLCNVQQVRQALSIDDDREWIFTPRLVTRSYLFEDCADADNPPLKKSPDNKHWVADLSRLKEVWFAGAHSDVGGGYKDSLLSGVSLNWMLDELRYSGLIPKGAGVSEDVYGTSHNPEGSFWKYLYHGINRDIPGYAFDLDTISGYQGTIYVHDSVFARRKMLSPESHEFKQLELTGPDAVCLESSNQPGLDNKGRRKQVDSETIFCKSPLKVESYIALDSKARLDVCSRGAQQ